MDEKKIKDNFIRKNCIDVDNNGTIKTEDLISGISPNKENKKRKKQSSRKKKLTNQEIAEKNKKIGNFFKKKSNSKKSKSKKIICEEMVDLTNNDNKIIEEIQEQNQENQENNVITEQKNKLNLCNKKTENEEILSNYKPPSMSLLEVEPTKIKPSKIKIKNAFKIPKKEDFVWKDKLFVITGKLNTTEDRKEMNTFLSFWGMIIRTSISKKTDILIHGEILDDGREYHQSGKYKKAVKFGSVKIVSEDIVNNIFNEFTGFSLEENFMKYNEDIENYPKNLYEDEIEDNEDLILDNKIEIGN